MFAPHLNTLVKTAVQLVFAILLALSAQAQAQSIVGTWQDRQNAGVVWDFDANGRWAWTKNGDQGPQGRRGSYTASGGRISITGDAASPGYGPDAYFYGSGHYAISGNFLDIELTGGVGGPVNILLTEIIDLSLLRRTELYVGYGSSDQEMLAAKRDWSIFKAQ